MGRWRRRQRRRPDREIRSKWVPRPLPGSPPTRFFVPDQFPAVPGPETCPERPKSKRSFRITKVDERRSSIQAADQNAALAISWVVFVFCSFSFCVCSGAHLGPTPISEVRHSAFWGYRSDRFRLETKAKCKRKTLVWPPPETGSFGILFWCVVMVGFFTFLFSVFFVQAIALHMAAQGDLDLRWPKRGACAPDL